jgi:hypothetical protein
VSNSSGEHLCNLLAPAVGQANRLSIGLLGISPRMGKFGTAACPGEQLLKRAQQHGRARHDRRRLGEFVAMVADAVSVLIATEN